MNTIQTYIIATIWFASAMPALGQQATIPSGTVFVPDSSKPKPIGVGPALAEVASDLTSVVGITLVTREELHNAVTNVAVFQPTPPATPPAVTQPAVTQPAAAQPAVVDNPALLNVVPQAAPVAVNAAADPMDVLAGFETPASVACIYALVAPSNGCNPRLVKTNASGGSKVIAIVDAFDDANAGNDLTVFSEHFGLPFKPETFRVVYAGGQRPPPDPTVGKGWEIETSLDIEWAHAMAPDARIVLVEAASSGLDDMYTAVEVANSIVSQAGGGEVSLSWGAAEFEDEITHDLAFDRQGIVHFASTGDHFIVSYPASSPHVVGVGGTTLLRDAQGNLLGETPWTNSGAGPSRWEPIPGYQNAFAAHVGQMRGIADIAAIADPRTGVQVYDSGNAAAAATKGWIVVGGTSAAAPIVAGIANAAGRFLPSGKDELAFIYSKAGSAAYSRVKPGKCGGYTTDGTTWSYCTGVGTPNGNGGL